jgi:hypothetical protein
MCLTNKIRVVLSGSTWLNCFTSRKIHETHITEGSLEVKLPTVKLPTIWTDEKQSRAERRESLEERRVEEKESEKRRCSCAKR